MAVETLGHFAKDMGHFIKEVGHRVSEDTEDSLSGAHLLQRISLAIQTGNAVSVMGTFNAENSTFNPDYLL